jgi:DNA-binding winged helix-turn-helix (wHTH) protein
LEAAGRGNTMSRERYAFGRFRLDPASGELRREGAKVALGQRAIALLTALLEADGQPVGKDALLDAAWPGTVVEEGNLTVQIAALRKTLGTRSDGEDWIVTVPRLGYRLGRSQASPPDDRRSSVPLLAVLAFDNLSGDPHRPISPMGLSMTSLPH